MTDKAIAAAKPKAEKLIALITALKVAAFLFVAVKVVSYVYLFFWDTFAMQPLTDMLGKWHVDAYQEALGLIAYLSVLPLALAIMTVLGPLIGWWIYSRVEPRNQDMVGWYGACFYLGANIAVMLFTGGWQVIYSWLAIVLSNLISLLFVMFLMGAGFNLAKLFKIKL